ncbi:MAG: hypothetical protein K8R53_07385, partial [Bacteroidales bacterium]|nr:hypothetical protein [Bacteroidales bacterium]
INDGELISYSGGFGYREQHFFIDLAGVYSMADEDYYLYSSPNISPPPAKNKLESINILMTIGFRY